MQRRKPIDPREQVLAGILGLGLGLVFVAVQGAVGWIFVGLGAAVTIVGLVRLPALGLSGRPAPRPTGAVTVGNAEPISLPASPLEQISRRVARNGDLYDVATARPLLSLEEFFEGNDDTGSIATNLIPTPSPREFYAALRRIRERSDVVDVLVEVTSHDAPDFWPYSDTVWVLTSAAPEAVKEWLEERLRPDEVFAGWTSDRPREKVPVPPGMTPVGLWWD